MPDIPHYAPGEGEQAPSEIVKSICGGQPQINECMEKTGDYGRTN